MRKRLFGLPIGLALAFMLVMVMVVSVAAATIYYVNQTNTVSGNITASAPPPPVNTYVAQTLYTDSGKTVPFDGTGIIAFGNVTQGGSASVTLYAKDVLVADIVVTPAGSLPSGVTITVAKDTPSNSITLTLNASPTATTGALSGITYHFESPHS